MSRQIEDYVSGQLVRETAEELVTQSVSRWLVGELGYRKEQLQTRPQWRVPRSPGVARSGGWPCDLVIFGTPGERGTASAVQAIFEMKAPTKLKTSRDLEHAERELKQYLQNEAAPRIGVLTNGIGPDSVTHVFYKYFKDDQIQWRELRAFPRAGEEPDLGSRSLKRK